MQVKELIFLLLYAFFSIDLQFFFSSRGGHTRSLCDWSSDVCSSDLDQEVHDRAEAAISGQPAAAGGVHGSRNEPAGMTGGRHIVFIAWRDLANKDAGGSEILVDRLAHGLTKRGDRVTLLCGGAVGERPYEVRRSGGTYSQFARAPLAFRRHLRDCDLVVEVCNGMPYLAPLGTNKPVVCLGNHVHTELWRPRFPPPIATLGRLTESKVMPWIHRRNLFLTISASTFAALQDIGVANDRIMLICSGVEPGPPPAPRSPEPPV